MSGECEICNNHTLECICGKNMKINAKKSIEMYKVCNSSNNYSEEKKENVAHVREEDIKTREISNILFSDDYLWLWRMENYSKIKEESNR